MKVLKFGGTSVGSPEMLRRVLNIVRDSAKLDQLIIVVSAFSGVTNTLEEHAQSSMSGKADNSIIGKLRSDHLAVVDNLFTDMKLISEVTEHVDSICNDLTKICRGVQLVGELTQRTSARILCVGELMSYSIIAAYFESEGIDCVGIDSRDLIVTKGDLLSGEVITDQTDTLLRALQGRANVVVIPGFVARDEEGRTSTLGRGGSDYTAALVAQATSAGSLEIWTDVSGVMTADPRLVGRAHPIELLSYAEAMELSFFGAKVIYPPTIQPLVQSDIPVWIKNTLRPDDKGTLITSATVDTNTTVKGISSIPDIGLITVSGSGMIGVPGTAMRMFTAMSTHDLSVLFITQSSSEHTITVGLKEEDAIEAHGHLMQAFEFEIEREIIDEIILETGLSLMAAVGDGMREHPGVAAKLFGLLGENGINIRAIAQGSTERNVSFVVKTTDTKKGLNAIHEGFFLSRNRVAHLFDIGVGNVGKALLGQLVSQQNSLREDQHLELRLSGLANSKKMSLVSHGIEIENWEDALHNGLDFNARQYAEEIVRMNVRNSVFIDNTGSSDIAQLYGYLLQNSIHVVTSNKIAASSSLDDYNNYKKLASEHGVQFRYETNVAAGLPVINTIKDMLMTGDKIHRIEAVLSGSLNYIFNKISPDLPFSEAVRQAREKGLTEPDPAIDLSGLDVQRKLLILARESGLKLEMSDVGKSTMIPDTLEMGSTWDDLHDYLKTQDAVIEEQRLLIEKQGKKWRFMATLDNGIAVVGIEAIDDMHPAWVLDGMDNLVLIYSERYASQPLVIKGAGAGPQVTASGVLADVLRIVNG